MTRTDRTETTRTDSTPTARTMRDVGHTHPYADEGALDRLFERGRVIAADGGRREAQPRDQSEGEEDEEPNDQPRMKDVDHTPPHGEGANRVFERGGERPVVSEE